MLFYSVTLFHSLSSYIYRLFNYCWLASWMSCWKSQRGRNLRNRTIYKRVCRWRRRSLHLSLVTRCRHCPRCCPPRLDDTLFHCPLTTKFKRWKIGRICAHISFRSAHLLRFGHGVTLPRQPYVDLKWSTTIRGTYGGTFGYENSGPHTDVPLDPKFLMLIWDTGASFGLTPF